MGRVGFDAHPLGAARFDEIFGDELVDTLLKGADADRILLEQFRAVRQFFAGQELSLDDPSSQMFENFRCFHGIISLFNLSFRNII